jgi:hydrogenase expression/formation protein HypC
MRIVEMSGDEGIAEQGGVRRKVSLALLDSVVIGDFVLVHAGFAIATLDEEEALRDIEAIDACMGGGEDAGP